MFITNFCTLFLFFLSTVASPSARKLKPRQVSPFPPGAKVHQSCSTQQAQVINAALQDAITLASNGLRAAATTYDEVFDFFFRPDDKKAVVRTMATIESILKGGGQSVTFCCEDLMNACQKNDFLAYIVSGDGFMTRPIVICPKFYDLPRLPNPCDKRSLETGRLGFGAAQAGAILHEMAHIPDITGVTKMTEDQGNFIAFARVLRTAEAAELQVSIELRERFQPTHNVFSYQHVAIWAWIRGEQQKTCKANWPLWKIVKETDLDKIRQILPADGTIDLMANERTELRKLLSQPENGGLSTEQQQKVSVVGLEAVDDDTPYETYAVPGESAESILRKL